MDKASSDCLICTKLPQSTDLKTQATNKIDTFEDTRGSSQLDANCNS